MIVLRTENPQHFCSIYSFGIRNVFGRDLSSQVLILIMCGLCGLNNGLPIPLSVLRPNQVRQPRSLLTLELSLSSHSFGRRMNARGFLSSTVLQDVVEQT